MDSLLFYVVLKELLVAKVLRWLLGCCFGVLMSLKTNNTSLFSKAEYLS